MEYICNDCPRLCGAKRNEISGSGFCLSPSLPSIARSAPHYGEEPCISGVRGSGTVFFSGCNLKCSFCQNSEISRNSSGRVLSIDQLCELFLKAQEDNVHNINLVTPTHYTRAVVSALERIKDRLTVPVVWNSSGYEKAETLKMLDGLVDIFMPDFKYSDTVLAGQLSLAPDYPSVACKAIEEMYAQRGSFILDSDGIMKSGVLIRHLILPGQTENSLNVIDYVADTFGDSVLFSLMAQYTPMNNVAPPFDRNIKEEENELLIHYMIQRKLVGYTQDTLSSTTEMIPKFDLTGLEDF